MVQAGGPNNGGVSNANCQGPKGTSFAPVYYTVEVTASGPVSLTSNHGPNNGTGPTITPTPTICTAAQNSAVLGTPTAGDNIVVQMIGFDYPAYEAAVGLTKPGTPQTPSITGPGGQSDITVSVQQEEDAPGYAQAPLSRSARSIMPLHRGSSTLIASPEVLRKLGIPTR